MTVCMIMEIISFGQKNSAVKMVRCWYGENDNGIRTVKMARC